MKELKMKEATNRLDYEMIGKYVFLAMIFITPFQHTTAIRNLLILLCFLFVIFEIINEGFDQSVPFKLPVAAWLIITWASVFYTVDLSYTLSELRNETLYTLILFYAGFVLGKKGLSAEVVSYIFISAFAVITAIAVFQYYELGYWSEEYVIGFRGYANYLVIALPLLFYVLKKQNDLIWILVLLLFAAFFLYAGILAKVRMTWVVFVLQGIVAFVLYLKLGGADRKLKIVVSVVLAALIGSSLAVLQYTNKERKGEVVSESFVKDPRIEAWPGVIEIIRNKPYYGLGYGKELFGKVYPEYQEIDRNLIHTHNLFLDYAVMLGLPGLAAVAYLFVSFLVFFYRHLKDHALLSLVAIVVLIGHLAKNLTDDFFWKDVALMIWMLVGVMSGVILRNDKPLNN